MQAILDRILLLFKQPKKEWAIIFHEYTSVKDLMIRYVLPLAGIAAFAVLLGYGWIGTHYGAMHMNGFGLGIVLAINHFIEDVGSILLGGYLVNALASYHRAEQNMEKSMQLIAYSYTPVFVGSIFNLIPSIAFVGNLISLYGIVLLYLGLTPMTMVPKNKKTTYFILILFAIFIIKLLIGYVLNGVLGNPYTEALLPGHH